MRIFLSVMFIILTVSQLFSQTKDREYFLDMSKALGYAYGIELTNIKIQNKFPELSKKAMLFQLDFNLAHGKAIESIENEIESKYEMNKEQLKVQLLNGVQKQLDFDHFSYEEASNYLNQFSEFRIYGNDELYKDFVSILLRHNPRYKLFPAKEFLNNFIELLVSDNHPKSKGLNLSIEYPKSWIANEGNRPNILKLLKSYDTSCIATLLIKDLFVEMGTDESSLTEEDAKYVNSGAFADEMVNDVFTHAYGKEYIEGFGLENVADFTYSKTKMDGQPTMVVKASGDLKRGILNQRVYTINYLTIYDHYLVNLGFMINGSNDTLANEIMKYELLCELISSSLIFIDKW